VVKERKKVNECNKRKSSKKVGEKKVFLICGAFHVEKQDVLFLDLGYTL
jgi:hypothetical protein